MRLIIFGAGASFDCVDLDTAPGLSRLLQTGEAYRPPLANQLFDERPQFVESMNRWPQMSPLVPRLRRAARQSGGPSIEAELRAIQEEADGFAWRRSHLFALRYYLREVLSAPVDQWLGLAGRATNYSGLLDQLGKRRNGDADPRWLLVTFNYDTLLEAALADVFSWGISSLADYLLAEFALIKPHGSVNWSQRILAPGQSRLPTGDPAQLARLAAQTPFVETDIGFGSNSFEDWQPALAIPVDRTKTFVCPADHQQRLHDDLEEVTSILIVGWRASEAHFLDLLYKRLPKNRTIPTYIVDYVNPHEVSVDHTVAGGYPVRDVLQEALGEVISFDFSVNNDGFSAFVASGAVHDLPA